MKDTVAHDSATPAHGQQVITAVPFIHREKDGEFQIFLAKRADTKAFLPGVYEMTGGHIDFGEDIVDGLKREVREELKVAISVGDAFACFTYVNNIKGSHSVQVGFFAQFVDSDPAIVLHPDDHSEARWFARHELVDNVASIRQSVDDANKDSSVQHLEGEDKELAMVLRGFDILEGNGYDLG